MIRHVLAPNPGPMTLDGTNTWILAPAGSPAIVVDPGPADPDHILAIESQCPDGVREVWFTHHHLDHTEAGPGLAARHGAAVRAYDPRLATATPFSDGESVDVGGAAVTAWHVPGHTADSVAFVVGGDTPALLTGDTVLGRGTTVIAAPDGDLGAYFTTLGRLQQLVADHGVRRILPGHGPVVTDPAGVVEQYRRHREERLAQVRECVATGAITADAVVDRVYGFLAPELRHAAVQSAQAQLDHLFRDGLAGEGPLEG